MIMNSNKMYKLGFVFLLLIISILVSANAHADLTDGIVSYYKLDENTGSTAGDSHGTNDGTITGATWTTGKINSALSKSTTSTNRVTGMTFNSHQDFTITGWINYQTKATDNAIITISDGTTNNFIRLKNRASNGGLGIHRKTGGSDIRTGYTAINTQEWYFFSFGIQGSTLFYKLFDSTGNIVNTDSTGVIGNFGSELEFLSWSYGGTDNEAFILDEVSIYNRALSLSEIEELYNSGAGLQYPFITDIIEITARDVFDNTSISNFSIEYWYTNTTNSTNFGTLSTTNGTIALNKTAISAINDTLHNITFYNAPNYFNRTFYNVSVANNYIGYLFPETLEDFTLLTPTDTKTPTEIFNVTWTEAVSPTGRAVSYNVSVINFANTTLDTFTTSNLYYELNTSPYNAGNYQIRVTGIEAVTDATRTHSGTLRIDKINYLYFKNGLNSNPLVNKNVTVKKPSSNTLNFVTDSEGKVSFQSYTNNFLEIGTYNITFEATEGFQTPISFTLNINENQIPFNQTYNISVAKINFEVRDSFTGSLITDLVFLEISNIGKFNTTNGTLQIINASLSQGSYSVLATSDDYTVAQRIFEFTNQEEIKVTLFMIANNATNLGTIFVNTYDSFLDVIPSADLRLQEFQPTTGSWLEIAQASTGSGGTAGFQIFLNTKKYRILATATIGGQVYSEYSNIDGEFFFTNGQIVNIYFNTIADTVVVTDGLVVQVSNTTLINNVSFHRVDFFDNQGLTHEVCLGYYYMHGIQKILYPSGLTCVNGSSGTIQAVGGTALDGSRTNVVEVFARISGKPDKVYYSQRYGAIGGFNTHFGDLVKPLIAVLSLSFLAIALYLRRIDIFLYLSILSSAVWSLVSPSILSGAGVVIISVFSMLILYLAKKRSGGEQV